MRSTLAPWLPRDAAVPDRDRLLDPTWVESFLSATLGRSGDGSIDGGSIDGVSIDEVSLRRVKYRVGESLRVCWQVRLSEASGHATRIVTARTFADSRGAFGRAMTAPGAFVGSATPFPALLHSAETSSVWWVLPNDRRLTQLDRVLHPGPSERLLPGLDSWTSSHVAEYAPERSLTIRADGPGGPVAFAKVYAPGTMDVPALVRLYGTVADALVEASVRARSPRALASTSSMLVLEPLPGQPCIGCDARALGLLGEALAVVHAVPAPSSLRTFHRFDDSRLATAAHLVGWAAPEVASRAVMLVDRLAASRPAVSALALLHGDCHPFNALVHGDGLSLIDLDQAASGPAAADIGSLTARLVRDELLGGPDARTALRSVLGGYARRAREPRVAEIRWYAAAALLAEQAVRRINRMRDAHLPLLGELVEIALRTLEAP